LSKIAILVFLLLLLSSVLHTDALILLLSLQKMTFEEACSHISRYQVSCGHLAVSVLRISQ